MIALSDNEIFAKFKEIGRFNDDEILFFMHNNLNSIRVRMSDEYTELVFTYISENEWKLETIDSYLYNMHGG